MTGVSERLAKNAHEVVLGETMVQKLQLIISVAFLGDHSRIQITVIGVGAVKYNGFDLTHHRSPGRC